jgi:hypothetical protein
MIKTGEIKTGVTPPGDNKSDKAASDKAEQLEDHLSKRAAEAASNGLRNGNADIRQILADNSIRDYLAADALKNK